MKYRFTSPSTTHLLFNFERKFNSKNIEFPIQKEDEVELEIITEQDGWALLQISIKNRRKNSNILGWLCLENLYMNMQDLVQFMSHTINIKNLEVV